MQNKRFSGKKFKGICLGNVQWQTQSLVYKDVHHSMHAFNKYVSNIIHINVSVPGPMLISRLIELTFQNRRHTMENAMNKNNNYIKL